MENPICFRILVNRNFGDFEIKISRRNRILEQPGNSVSLNITITRFNIKIMKIELHFRIRIRSLIITAFNTIADFRKTKYFELKNGRHGNPTKIVFHILISIIINIHNRTYNRITIFSHREIVKNTTIFITCISVR